MKKLLLFTILLSFLSILLFHYYVSHPHLKKIPVTEKEKLIYLDSLGKADAIIDFMNGKPSIKSTWADFVSWFGDYVELLKEQYNIRYDFLASDYSIYENRYLHSYNKKVESLIEMKYGKSIWDNAKTKAKYRHLNNGGEYKGFLEYDESPQPFYIEYNSHIKCLDSLFGKGVWGIFSYWVTSDKTGKIISFEPEAISLERGPLKTKLFLGYSLPIPREEKTSELINSYKKLKVWLSKFSNDLRIKINKQYFSWTYCDTIKWNFRFSIRENICDKVFNNKVVSNSPKVYIPIINQIPTTQDLDIHLNVWINKEGKIKKYNVSSISLWVYKDSLSDEYSYHNFDYDSDFSKSYMSKNKPSDEIFLINKFTHIINEALENTHFIIDKNNEYFKYYDIIEVPVSIEHHSINHLRNIKQKLFEQY